MCTMYLKMNEKLLRRINEAFTHIKILNNKAAPRYKSRTSEAARYLYRLLDSYRGYVIKNAGVVPPNDHGLLFDHTDETIAWVNKGDEKLRTIWYLLSEKNQAAHKKQYQAVNNLIDETRGYLVQLKTKGIWSE